ncbi:MAG TPA: HAMP domain-containing sensor histidine kinase [Flavobacterium sp.]|nr:HAMP domain-containing sensor histidine kinase [Flavobacterium sp.]
MTQSWKIHHAFFIRLLVLLVLLGSCIVLFQKQLYYTLFGFVFFGILLTLEMYYFIRNAFLFYDKTITAILQQDYSASYSDAYKTGNYSKLHQLYETLKERRNEQTSKELVYRTILNNIDSGVLILEKKDAEWGIFLMNDYFSNQFTVPKVSKWHYLKKQIPSFCSAIEQFDFQEVKTSVQIRANADAEFQTFRLQASLSKSYNTEYYIIFLDSIQKVIEKKEKEAWINLMKVISHELLNSLTPIRSLSQNLQEIVDQDALSSEDLEDIRLSLSTIINRSDHLQFFVDNYRKLAMLPSPQKEKTGLQSLVKSCVDTMMPLFKTHGISVHNKIDFDRWLYVDRNQLEQVILNLLTNSMYALTGDSTDSKVIELSASVANNRLFIVISDNGAGIEKEIQDKIFLPFFTTRKEGAGIGLTLSKNIIEAHGGYLNYQRDSTHTTFVISLIEKENS